MSINRADLVFQRSLIDSMAEALANGLIEKNLRERERWAARAEALATVASNEYGMPVATALLDQALSESTTLAARLKR